MNTSLPHSSQPSPQNPAKAAAGCFVAFSGIAAIIGSLGIGIVGWFILETLATNVRENAEATAQTWPTALKIIEHRAWLPVLAIPSLLAGIALMRPARLAIWRWPLIILAELWIAILIAAILYCFLALMAPLYQYQPL